MSSASNTAAMSKSPVHLPPEERKRCMDAFHLLKKQTPEVIQSTIYLCYCAEPVLNLWYQLIEHGQTALTVCDDQQLNLNLHQDIWLMILSLSAEMRLVVANGLTLAMKTTRLHLQPKISNTQNHSPKVSQSIQKDPPSSASATLQLPSSGLSTPEDTDQASSVDASDPSPTDIRGRPRARSHGELAKKYYCPVYPQHCHHQPFARLQNCKNHILLEHKWYINMHPQWEDNIRIGNGAGHISSLSPCKRPETPRTPASGSNISYSSSEYPESVIFKRPAAPNTNRRRSAPNIRVSPPASTDQPISKLLVEQDVWNAKQPSSSLGRPGSGSGCPDPREYGSYASVPWTELGDLTPSHDNNSNNHNRNSKTTVQQKDERRQNWLSLTPPPPDSYAEPHKNEDLRGL